MNSNFELNPNAVVSVRTCFIVVSSRSMTIDVAGYWPVRLRRYMASATAAMRMSPCTTCRTGCGRPRKLSSVKIAVSVSAPAIAAGTDPRPPSSCAPPSTAAVIACSS